MSKLKLRQTVAAILIASLLFSGLSSVVFAAASGAPLAQGVRSQSVTGTITGGNFSKIWLGLEPQTQGENITVVSEWDQTDPENHGLGFFILDPAGLNKVRDGSANVRDINLAAGSKASPSAPANQLTAQFRATAGSYTIVVFNDSNTDANFSLKATNGIITDGSNQVKDANATATPVVTTTVEANAAETPAPAVATPAPTAAVAAATPAPAAVATAAPVMSAPKEVRAQELRGELPKQNDQNYLGLEPSVRDGNISLILSFEPQDSSELARRLNFWVLDKDGFNKLLDPNSKVTMSELAIAAGSSDPQLPSNERKASFKASGFGPYTVVVYNTSNVPGTYTLRVEGGVLIDDSGQTLTAQAAMTQSSTVTSTAEAGKTTAATPAASSAASTATSAGSGIEGKPGGTYTVKSGDSLSLIAKAIYGQIGLWQQICSFNKVTDCNRIEVGTVLRLPTTAEIQSGATVVATAAPAATVATPAPVPATTAAAAAPVVTATAAVSASSPVTSSSAVSSTAAMTSATGTKATGGELDLVATLKAAGSFDTLIKALTAAGLVDALKGAGPFTIFAPTDAAFADLPAGALDQLLANPTGQLTQILLFHIIPSKLTSAEITTGMKATTQQGKAVSFEVAGGKIKVNGANVVVPDIEASNGVIHAIDAVILPPP